MLRAVNEEGGKPFHSNQLDDSLFTPIDITLHGEVKEIAFAQNPPAKGLTWKTGLWELPIPKDTGSKCQHQFWVRCTYLMELMKTEILLV